MFTRNLLSAGYKSGRTFLTDCGKMIVSIFRKFSVPSSSFGRHKMSVMNAYTSYV